MPIGACIWWISFSCACLVGDGLEAGQKHQLMEPVSQYELKGFMTNRVFTASTSYKCLVFCPLKA